MEVQGSIENPQDMEDASRSVPQSATEPRATVLYTVLSTEEVDSSIREFSYIWSSGGFDIGQPDTDRLGGGGDGSCHIAIFKIDTEATEHTQQCKAEKPQSVLPQKLHKEHDLLTLPATTYSENAEENSQSSSRSHRRGSSSIYTPIPKLAIASDRSIDTSLPQEKCDFNNSMTRFPFEEAESDRYSDCLQDGEAYCNNRYVFSEADAASLSTKIRNQCYQEDFTSWQRTSRNIESSDSRRFLIDIPPRSRSLGRRLISRMKIWRPVKQDNASSKRSITGSIASSWSKKAKSVFKKASLRDLNLSRNVRSSHQSIRTVSPKSIFSRAQKSPVSNCSESPPEVRYNENKVRAIRRPTATTSIASKELPALNLPAQLPIGEPRPFQCTFCLMQWDNKEEWTYHEAAFHMRPYGSLHQQKDNLNGDDEVVFSMSDVVSIHTSHEHDVTARQPEEPASECLSFGYHLYSNDTRNQEDTRTDSWDWLENRSDWFWHCGFCETILRSWAERQEHFIEHFDNETTMVSWDPLRSPYPISKFTLAPVEGFPSWDWSQLHYAIGASVQNKGLWYRTPESWVCPGPEHACNPTVFFETATVAADAPDLASLHPDEHSTLRADRSSVATKAVYTYDYCLCCGEVFHESPPDWEMRKQHLRDIHCISETSETQYDHTHNHGQRFYREELFSLHLANCHNVRLDYLTEFTEFCRKTAQAPVLMLTALRRKS